MEPYQDDVHVDYKEMFQKEFSRRQQSDSILRTLYSTTPDMLWIKDHAGRYIWGNSKLLSGLLCQHRLEDIKGKTDLEIAGVVKTKTIECEHTAGGTCTDSDIIVMQKGKEMLFIEEFMIQGVHLVLAVKKNVQRNAEGDIIGTVGVGRDITDMYNILHEATDAETAIKNARRYIERHFLKDDSHE